MPIKIDSSPFARDVSPVEQKIREMGPTHIYRCRERSGNILIDSSGNERHGQVYFGKENPFNGQYLRIRGKYGDYASIPTNGLFDNPNVTGFSFMTWMSSSNITDRDHWYRIIDLASNIGSSAPYNTLEITKMRDNNSIFARWSNTSWGENNPTSFGDFVENQWYHLAYTFKNMVETCYVNGKMVSRVTIEVSPAYTSRPYLFLGKSTDTAVANSTISYRDVVFFNKEILAEDIAEVYELSKPDTVKIYGIAKSDSIPPISAKVVLVRSLPDNETKICQVNQVTGYWETYVSKDHVYDITAYGQDGSIYKPQIYGPVEVQ